MYAGESQGNILKHVKFISFISFVTKSPSHFLKLEQYHLIVLMVNC